MTARILLGDAVARLRELPDGSVHCVVTSPAYWGLRKYQAGPQEMGSEATPGEHIERLVAVFRELRRVLRDDGTLWLNYGDAMPDGELTGLPERLVLALQADGWVWRSTVVWTKPAPMPESMQSTRWEQHRVKAGGNRRSTQGYAQATGQRDSSGGLPPSDTIWAPCPGCLDCAPNDGLVLRRGSWRPTRAWEPIFMLTKGPGYYADGEAVKTPNSPVSLARVKNAWHLREGSAWVGQETGDEPMGSRFAPDSGANLRNVWVIPPEPCNWDFCLACGTFFQGQLRRAIKGTGLQRRCPCGATDTWVDHYAAFPSELPRRCIAASTSQMGVCATCGAPWARIIEKQVNAGLLRAVGSMDESDDRQGYPRATVDTQTLGWRPTCSCTPAEPVPATVLDPFMGTGTTLLAASRLGRDAIGIELSPRYVALAQARLRADAPLLGMAQEAAQDGQGSAGKGETV